MPTFQDHIVWITGASSGIGRALAHTFADEGAHVAVSARRENLLHDLTNEVEAKGRRALPLPCDVTDEAQIEKTVDEIIRHFGQLDVAVANAGFGVTGRVEDLGADEWRRQLDVNVVGLAMTARYALPHLRETKGRLALVGSVGAMIPTPTMSAYSASKAAVRMIGQTLAMELHGSGVTCTTLHPGFVESNITRVDNEGNFHPDRDDPRPEALRWPTDRAARTMVQAIHRRKREYVFTGHGKFFGFLGRHCPGLVHFATTRGILPAP